MFFATFRFSETSFLLRSMNQLTGPSPRITLDQLASFRGQYVTILLTLVDRQNDGTIVGRCPLTNLEKKFVAPLDSEFTKNSEVTAYVQPNGEILYHSHGMLDDEIDLGVYSSMLKIMNESKTRRLWFSSSVA